MNPHDQPDMSDLAQMASEPKKQLTLGELYDSLNAVEGLHKQLHELQTVIRLGNGPADRYEQYSAVTEQLGKLRSKLVSL